MLDYFNHFISKDVTRYVLPLKCPTENSCLFGLNFSTKTSAKISACTSKFEWFFWCVLGFVRGVYRCERCESIGVYCSRTITYFAATFLVCDIVSRVRVLNGCTDTHDWCPVLSLALNICSKQNIIGSLWCIKVRSNVSIVSVSHLIPAEAVLSG